MPTFRNRRRVPLRLLTALALAVAAGVPSVDAPAAAQPRMVRRHALLIGIGNYPVKPLDGPRNDVRSLAALLRERYRFDAVTIVEDEQATREGILRAIDALATTTAPGDVVLVYYSGHGTSALDRRIQLPGLSSFTGALLPADFAAAGRDLLGRLIVGARDLRPRFARLEADRDVVVFFDTCYSANTARSLRVSGGSASRSVPWEQVAGATRAGGISFGQDDAAAEFGRETEASQAYPYKRVVYFAAAGAGEEAEDIASWRVKQFPTIDGQAHGAFTNALLKGLQGYANSNGDDTLTYRELFEYTRGDVTRQFPHTPQVSVPERREDLLDRPVFATRGVARPIAPPPPAGPLRVLVAPGAPAEIAAAIRGVPDVAIVATGAHDIRVEVSAGAASVLHASGDRLGEYAGPPSTLAALVGARVRRQALVHPLLQMAFAEQTFNVSVTLPAPRGYLEVGERSAIRFESEARAHLLILNVEVDGKVLVLYPQHEPEAREAVARVTVDVAVDPAGRTGTEFVKVFAFEQRPAGLESWSGRVIDGDAAAIDRLMGMVRSAAGRRAQALLKIVTAPKGG